jgi:hypothetical protein
MTQSEAVWFAGPTATHGEDVADIVSAAQDATVVRRKKRNAGALIGGENVLNRGKRTPAGKSSCSALEKAASVLEALQRGSVYHHASTVCE